MSKRKNQNASANKPAAGQPAPIDYEKLADAIVRAHDRIEKKKQNEIAEERRILRESVGLKEDKRGFAHAFNVFLAFFRFLFMGEKKIRTLNITYGLIQEFTGLAFKSVEIASWLVVLLIAISAYNSSISALQIGLGFLLFVTARVFHIAKVEVEKMNNRQEIIAIASAVAAIFAAVIAVVALIIEVV